MPIVDVIVSQQSAARPATLQRTGCFVSQGGTTLTIGTSRILTTPADLTPLLRESVELSALAWLANIVTATTATPHGYTVGDELNLVISGCTPVEYNGTYLCTITATDEFTYSIPDPGLNTVLGTVAPLAVSEVSAMNSTYFAQGFTNACYLLELGLLEDDAAIASLADYIALNQNNDYTPGADNFFYGYLVPRKWDGNANFLALVLAQSGLMAKTYFFITSTLETYNLYGGGNPDVAQSKAAYVAIDPPQMSVYPSVGIASMNWGVSFGGFVLVVTDSPHGISVGDWFEITGVTGDGAEVNGWHQAALTASGTSLRFSSPTNPGTMTGGTILASLAEHAGTPITEFPTAADFFVVLNNKPSSTNKVPPMAFSFVYGVTAWPLQGLGDTLALLKAANVNYHRTGAEGGISNTTIYWGTTNDGHDFLYWYSVDAAQIFGKIGLANTVINGSNSKINPLYYNQPGINRLQDNLVATMGSLVTWGLANGVVSRAAMNSAEFQEALDAGEFVGQIVVNAIPYFDYLEANPSDYAAGQYDGLFVQYIPSRGFIGIIFTIEVTELITT